MAVGQGAPVGSLSLPTLLSCKEPCGEPYRCPRKLQRRVEAKGWFIYAEPIIYFLFIINFLRKNKREN